MNISPSYIIKNIILFKRYQQNSQVAFLAATKDQWVNMTHSHKNKWIDLTYLHL